MTGTDPGNGSTAAKPPQIRRWRAGRYSLSRIFLNFYLLAMGSFVAIAFFADVVISSAVKGITDDYARRFMHGTILMLEEDLARHPIPEWPDRVKILDQKFSYRIDLIDIDNPSLTQARRDKLLQGEIVVEHDGEIMYRALRDSSLVLVVGPLSPDRNPEELERKGIPLELRIQLLTWSLMGVCFAVALWFWVRPIWRDLEALRQTARAFGEGNLDARSPEVRSQLFAPLADTLDGMADRIQQLIATHKELSSSISHELRTPIARLRFALEMLETADEKKDRERLGKMMESDLDELDNLIDTSLTYARFEREIPSLNPQDVPLQQWLEDEVDNLRLLGRNLHIQTDFSRWPQGQMVNLDPKIMPHAVRNLLRNAMKYAHAAIHVSAEYEHGQTVIHIDDDGVGIPEAERERIFSPFTRLDRSRDRATGGYGLGLAITRRVMELHGGAASASASPMGGARFTLRWPS